MLQKTRLVSRQLCDWKELGTDQQYRQNKMKLLIVSWQNSLCIFYTSYLNLSAGLLNMKVTGSYGRGTTYRCSEDIRKELWECLWLCAVHKNYWIYLKRLPVNFILSILLTEENQKAAWRLETGRLQWDEAGFPISKISSIRYGPQDPMLWLFVNFLSLRRVQTQGIVQMDCNNLENFQQCIGCVCHVSIKILNAPICQIC